MILLSGLRGPHELPVDDAWLSQRWSFYDVDPVPPGQSKPYKCVSISVRDMMDTKKF